MISMSDHNTKQNVVRDNYNDSIFAYETRRLPEESLVEYAITLRWLDHWIADGATVADIDVGVGHYACYVAQRGCKVYLVNLAETLLQAASTRPHTAGFQEAILGITATCNRQTIGSRKGNIIQALYRSLEAIEIGFTPKQSGLFPSSGMIWRNFINWLQSKGRYKNQ